MLGVTHLLASPLKRVVSDNLLAFGQNTCFLEAAADGIGKSMVLGPGGRNGESPVQPGAAFGLAHKGLGSGLQVGALGFLYPTETLQPLHTINSPASGHLTNGPVVFLDHLAANVAKLGHPHARVRFQDAQEVSGLDRDMLAGVSDEEDAGAGLLSDSKQGASELVGLQTGLIDDQYRIAQSFDFVANSVDEKVADSGGRSESVTFEDLGCRGGWSEVVDGLARDFQGTGDFAQAGGLARAGEATDSAHLIGTGKCLKHDPALLVRLKLESNPFDGTEGLPVILGAIDKANSPAFQAPGLQGS